jgi:glycosyltransferase involved in cell wall biosynthesis
MKLYVNGPALMRSSRGVRRYYDSVMRHLAWPGGITVTAVGRSAGRDRIAELLSKGARDGIFWSPCQRGPLFADRHVVTVHDCINIEHTYTGWKRLALKLATQQMLGNATAIVAISHATKAAILRNYRVSAESIVVIPSPCGVVLEEADHEPSEVAAPADGRPYVMMVTNSLPHKNTVRACAAFVRSGAVKRGVGLRVVGALAPEALAICQEADVDLTIGTRLDDNTLRQWYRGSRFLLSPSLAEGHNLTIGEALVLQANVLCSDIPVHREFYAERAAFFDPEDVDAMTVAIKQALDRPGRWFDVPLPARSFRDVAEDYRRLFEAI